MYSGIVSDTGGLSVLLYRRVRRKSCKLPNNQQWYVLVNDTTMCHINLLFTGLDLLGHQDKRKNSAVSGNFHITLSEPSCNVRSTQPS